MSENTKKLQILGDFTGLQGPKGDKGDPFTYEDFTEEQLAALASKVTSTMVVTDEEADEMLNEVFGEE